MELRKSETFIVPKCRLTCYANSFFPSQSIFWNKLNNEIVKLNNLATFKNKISNELFDLLGEGYDHMAFSTLSSYHGKILTQIRLGHSPLRQHQFKHNITDNPFCPSCGNFVETIDHYFLVCSTFVHERTILFHKLSLVIQNWPDLDDESKLDLLIKGYKVKNIKNATTLNIKIFEVTQCYMQQTRRFLY